MQFILEEKDIERINVSGITVHFIIDITAYKIAMLMVAMTIGSSYSPIWKLQKFNNSNGNKTMHSPNCHSPT